MDFKRLTAFFAIALVIMIGWEKMFPTPKPVPAPQQAAQKTGSNRFRRSRARARNADYRNDRHGSSRY